MQLNEQELQFIIGAIDGAQSGSLDRAAMKGSLLIKLATELHTQMNPPAEEPAPLKEVKK